MEKVEGWERLGQLSRMLQSFRRMYVHREIEEDSPVFLEWRRKLLRFLKGLLLSCEVQGTRESGDWVHFRFEGTLSKVLGHSCCDWSSPDAFGCGLMLEVLRALSQVQSELPVCGPAIVHVLLHRLAVVRPGKEARGPFLALVSGLQDALDACPAMPGATLEHSIDDCLRRPAGGAAAWSLGATRKFVGGVLSLVSRSPRSLCQAVVSALVRFVAETGCGFADGSLAGDAEEHQEPRCRRRCFSCDAAVRTGGSISKGTPDAAQAAAAAERRARPLRCSAQEKRDLVLEGVIRWAVDVHFRQCSSLLQASLNRAVCDGIRRALDAVAAASYSSCGRAPAPSFPLGCRLLLSFVGGLAGDGGAQAALFLRERCWIELRLFASGRRARFTRCARRGSGLGTGIGGRVAVAAAAATGGVVSRRRWPELPVLEAYVGHLCLCRHVSDALAAGHLEWLARQALAILRLLDGPDRASGVGVACPAERLVVGEIAAAAAGLTSISCALALLLTRPRRGGGGGHGRGGRKSTSTVVTEAAGNLLEIVFDSDARPLSGVPVPLAQAAVGALKEAGYLRLARTEDLLRPLAPALVKRRPRVLAAAGREAHHLSPVFRGTGDGSDAGDYSFIDGVEFRCASVAFRGSWCLAAAGLDARLPLLTAVRKRRLGSGGSGADAESSADSGDSDSSDEGDMDISADSDAEPADGNVWDRVPDEVALRVFSFLTPKRVCRLACVDRAWRELVVVSTVWRPFFEARWPVTFIDKKEDLVLVSDRLLREESRLRGAPSRKRRRGGSAGVVRWGAVPEDTSSMQPPRDWMALYRDRHRAERAARGRRAAKTNFSWLVCPFLGCVCSLKSEYSLKIKLLPDWTCIQPGLRWRASVGRSTWASFPGSKLIFSSSLPSGTRCMAARSSGASSAEDIRAFLRKFFELALEERDALGAEGSKKANDPLGAVHEEAATRDQSPGRLTFGGRQAMCPML